MTAETQTVLDPAQLDRCTLGDAALRREILTLFRQELSTAVAKLYAASTPADWMLIAHTLKGSSRTVGAERLAAAAERAERLRPDAAPSDRAGRIREVESAITEVMPLIDAHLSPDESTA